MHDPLNGRVLRVVGMSRSGNHAIINWILSQLRGSFCFLNCTEPGSNPFASARPLADGRRFIANYDVDLAAEAKGDLTARDTLIYSHEDVFLGPVARDAGAAVGGFGEWLDVLILRDPFNLFASRRKTGFAHMTDHTARRIWKQHAREALKPKHLSCTRLVILFNEWAQSRRYRAQIAEQLRLGFNDGHIERVARCNGGSSFDGLRYDGEAGSMRVTERWRHFWDAPAFRSLFDDQTRALSRDLFGLDPCQQQADSLAAVS